MKVSGVRGVIVAACLFSYLPLWAQNPNNPIQDGLLRWYQANQATTFSPCGEPQGLAFDGVNMWVACGAAGTGPNNALVELASSDGSQVRTVLSVQDPYALVYDGANIWASNPNNGTVTEVRARDGVKLATISVGSRPMGMAFDGQYIWVANNGTGSNSLSRIDPSTGSSVPYSLANCSQPWGVAFDGTNLWVACFSSNAVVEFSRTSLSVFAVVDVELFPTFVAFDGSNVWVSDFSSAKVSTFPAANPPVPPTHAPTFPVGAGPYGVVFDTEYIWVANGGDNTVTKLLATTGTNVATCTMPSGGLPVFVASDGGNVWVSNTSGSTVSKC